MDLFDELRKLIEVFRESKLEYALCGGFGLAAHGIVRATEDIDLMLDESSLSKLRGEVEPMGFWFQPERLIRT